MGKGFIIGVIAGVIGYGAAAVLLVLGGILSSMGGDVSMLNILCVLAIASSTLGVAGAWMERAKNLSGVLMIIAAIGMFVTIDLWGLLSSALFIVAAIMVIGNKNPMPARSPYQTTGQGGAPGTPGSPPRVYDSCGTVMMYDAGSRIYWCPKCSSPPPRTGHLT